MEKFSFYLSGTKLGDQWWDHKSKRIRIPELENIEARNLDSALMVARTVFSTIAEKYLVDEYKIDEYCKLEFTSRGWAYMIRPKKEKSFNVEMALTKEQRSVDIVKTTVHAIYGKVENEANKGEIVISVYEQLCKIHSGKEVQQFKSLITIYDPYEKSLEQVRIKFISRG